MSEWKISEKFNLPNNWDIVRLNELTSQIVDGTHFTPKYTEHGIPFLRVSDIQAKKIEFNGLKFISKEEHDILKLRCFPKKGDILVSKNGSIGLIKIVDWDWEFSIFVSLALIKTQKDIYNVYLKYLLQSDIVWWQIKLRSKQGTVTNLHLEEIRELEIPKPPLPTQRKIARILSTADAVIEKTQAAIAKYKAIKQGMLHDLFTRGIDTKTGKLRTKYEDAPELYKESKLGWIPKEWEVEILNNLCSEKPTYGINAAAVDFNHHLPTYIRITDIDEDGNFSKTGRKCVNSTFSNDYILKKGDLVFARTGATVGKTYLYNESDGLLVYAGFLIKVTPDNFLLDYYFLKFLTETSYYLNWVEVMSQRSGQPGINGNEYGGLMVPKPERSEQELISKRLLTIQNKIQTEQNYLHKLQQIKAGLMADLLSGKKEVVVDEDKAN